KAAASTDRPVAARAALSATRDRLHATAIAARLGAVSSSGDNAKAPFMATMTLGGLGSWTYAGRLLLHRTSGRWVVHWDPTDIHPALTATTQLSTTRALPPRATILDIHGRPLFASRPVVNVGIEPSRLKGHLRDTVGALVRALRVDGGRLTAAVKAA